MMKMSSSSRITLLYSTVFFMFLIQIILQELHNISHPWKYWFSLLLQTQTTINIQLSCIIVRTTVQPIRNFRWPLFHNEFVSLLDLLYEQLHENHEICRLCHKTVFSIFKSFILSPSSQVKIMVILRTLLDFNFKVPLWETVWWLNGYNSVFLCRSTLLFMIQSLVSP